MASKPIGDFGENWSLTIDGESLSTDRIALVLQYKILQELKAIRRLLDCHNCRDIPNILRGIRRKIPVKKKRVKK